MMAWLQSLESSSWAIWLKGSPSVWGYPTLLFLHTMGIAFTAGPSIVIDLRLLGSARSLPLAHLDAFFRVIWMAFALNVASGAVLFASDATAKLANPAFLVKMTCVVFAAGLTIVIRRRMSADTRSVPHDDGSIKLLAVASMLCWVAAIAAGRYMAYF